MRPHDFRKSPRCPYGDLVWDRYWWVRPQEIPQYEQDYWGDKVKDPDGVCRDLQSAEEFEKHKDDLKFVINLIHDLPPGRMLDVGCGPGYLLSAVSPMWERHGVDISAHGLKSAQRFGKVQRGELPRMDYPAEFFDVVVMNHVIEHVPDPLEYVLACRRILKPGGVFVMATPDFDSACARHFKTNFRMLHDTGHIRLFTSFSLVRLLEDHRFRISEVEHPYFESRYFNRDNLLRMLDTAKVSPPFHGNHVVVVSEKLPDPS